MQCSVSISVEVDPAAGLDGWEPAIQAAGWKAR